MLPLAQAWAIPMYVIVNSLARSLSLAPHSLSLSLSLSLSPPPLPSVYENVHLRGLVPAILAHLHIHTYLFNY